MVLVRAGQDHLPGLHAAIETSHAELERWMDWVGAEPQSIETTRAHLATRLEAWDNGEEFGFTMMDPVDAQVIGVCSLMSRPGPGRLEIGYWVRSDRAGDGVASAAAELLTDAGLDISGIDIVEIHHDAANGASGRIPQKLGYTEVVRRDVEIDNPGEVGLEVIWEISRAERP